MKIDWNKEFATAHLTSGPMTNGLTVSKIKPNGTGARSIYNDDKNEIMTAANQYDFKVLFNNNSVISFIKQKQNEN